MCVWDEERRIKIYGKRSTVKESKMVQKEWKWIRNRIWILLDFRGKIWISYEIAKLCIFDNGWNKGSMNDSKWNK